jgi:uncharacterized membrane protein
MKPLQRNHCNENTAMKPLHRFVVAYGAAALVFLPLDALWLTLMSEPLYRPALGHLLAAQPDAAAIVLFYLLYFVGVVVFAVRPAASAEPWITSAARAAVFGLVAYGTYDLTNQATLAHWPWMLTAVDLAWGSAITAVAASAARFAVKRTTAAVNRR